MLPQGIPRGGPLRWGRITSVANESTRFVRFEAPFYNVQCQFLRGGSQSLQHLEAPFVVGANHAYPALLRKKYPGEGLSLRMVIDLTQAPTERQRQPPWGILPKSLVQLQARDAFKRLPREPCRKRVRKHCPPTAALLSYAAIQEFACCPVDVRGRNAS